MITVSTVAQATDTKLLCITYELFLDAVKDSLKASGEERRRCIEQAKEVLKVLTENLNFEVALASQLFDLYVYVQNILINASQEDMKLEEAYRLIDMIYQGYVQLDEKQQGNTPSIENAQTIYAGMTYGKGYLSEMTMDSQNRGFKA